MDGNSGEESVRFEAKKPEQDSGFDDLSETKYGKKQEKLSQLGLRAIDIKEIEDELDEGGKLSPAGFCSGGRLTGMLLWVPHGRGGPRIAAVHVHS